MKFTVLAVSAIFLLLITTGCKKSGKDEPRTSDSLTGTWELRRIQGNIPRVTYAPGNGNIIQFTANRYKVLSNSQVKEEGTYRITADSTAEANVCILIKQGEYTDRINFSEGSNQNKIFFNIEANQLSFLSGCFAFDAGSKTVYERVDE